MKTQDLLPPEAIDQLQKVYQLAIDVNETINKFIDNGIPYTEHQAKAKEQLDVLRRWFNALDLPI